MEKRSSSDTDVYMGPYRATKLWNDVIYMFRKEMPCGKHRRYMRTHEDCFVASTAVEWVHNYMKNNPNFGNDVTRAQTVQLLQKIYKAGVFEDVRGPKHGRADFAENGRLYRFTNASSPKTTARTPLSTQENLVNCDTPKTIGSKPLRTEEDLRSCHLVAKILTPDEIEDVWKTFTLSRLQSTIGVENLTDIMDSQLVCGHNIMHNCIYINKSGLVTNVEAKDQLPPWAMSAMKCLARWPEKVEENLPNYAGFEKDVFGVVKDYFTALPEPLLTYNMYEVITNVFVCAEDNIPRHSSPNVNSVLGRSTPTTPWCYPSIENLLLNMTRSGSFGKSYSKYSQPLRLTSASTLNLSHIEPVLDTTRFDSASVSGEKSCPITHYETAFGPDNRTVTRVYFSQGVSTDYGHPSSDEEELGMPLETHFDLSTERSGSTHSDSGINFTRVKSLDGLDRVKRRYARRSSGNTNNKRYSVQLSKSLHSSDTPVSGKHFGTLPRSHRTGHLPSRPPSTSSYDSYRYQPILDGSQQSKSNRRLSTSSPDIASILDNEAKMTNEFTDSVENCKSASYRETLSAEERAKKALQLVCLILPPANRRQLQLLLKLMYKMCHNTELNLDPTQSTRSLVLRTFYRCILNCNDSNEMDEVLVIQLVSFLMDHHAEIFSVPTELKMAVEDRLTNLQKPKVSYSPDDPSALRYCLQQVTVETFESHKVENSQKALVTLLESIVQDTIMADKEKRKRLKLFQKTYPDIYTKRFPTTESVAEVFPSKPKIKQPLLVKPFMKLRGIRM